MYLQTGQCDLARVQTNKMGETADTSKPGIFYLRTYAKPPFAIPPAFIGYQEDQVYTEECCLAVGKHTLSCDDTYKDGWHGGFIAIQGEEYCKDFFDGHVQKQDIEIIFSGSHLQR